MTDDEYVTTAMLQAAVDNLSANIDTCDATVRNMRDENVRRGNELRDSLLVLAGRISDLERRVEALDPSEDQALGNQVLAILRQLVIPVTAQTLSQNIDVELSRMTRVLKMLVEWDLVEAVTNPKHSTMYRATNSRTAR
jgi:hypothetical protein